ncbi:thiamine pyrophosphate-binding protein [Streptomyces asoensis]|uniref:thiamine pyrophosphate-binding protein n=1 Tax=Streptomyces asoensis TaxID=249586 RepID=UPI003682F60F
MSTKVSDHVLRRLRAWGVEQVFGCPGDGVEGLLAAWGRAADGPRFVRARDEEAAAFEAAGHAVLGGRLGVCVTGSGPGAVRLLDGLYGAEPDGVPVLAIVGRPPRDATHRQEADTQALFGDRAPEFVETVTAPEQLPGVLDRAIREAYARRAPAVVVLPGEVQEREGDTPADEFAAVPSDPGPDGRTAVPSEESLRRAAELLDSGDKVAILVGRGAAGARSEVERIAGLLGAGIAKDPLGKDVIGDELPCVTGVIGPLGTRPSYELTRDCDTLLTIGSSFADPDFLPDPGKARGVRIGVDPLPAGTHGPHEVDLVGDAGETLRRLIPMIRGEERGREWPDTVRDNVRHWHDVLERRARLSADPINPEHVARALDPLLPPDVLVVSDPGPVASWYARHVTMRSGMRGALCGTPGSAGGAVPYAIGAKFAHPDRPVIALAGSASMRRNGLAELITAARYQDRWADRRLVVAVWNSGEPEGAAEETHAGDGAPASPPPRQLPDGRYAEFARSLGLTGVRVEDPDAVEAAWRTAWAADGPAVVEFLTDPTVPPVPPHATWEQVEATAASVLRGDAGAVAELGHGFRAKIQEFLPDREPDRETDPETDRETK